MNPALLLSGAGLGLGSLVARLIVTIRRDGYGHRPPPAGGRHWAAGTTLDDVR